MCSSSDATTMPTLTPFFREGGECCACALNNSLLAPIHHVARVEKNRGCSLHGTKREYQEAMVLGPAEDTPSSPLPPPLGCRHLQH